MSEVEITIRLKVSDWSDSKSADFTYQLSTMVSNAKAVLAELAITKAD